MREEEIRKEFKDDQHMQCNTIDSIEKPFLKKEGNESIKNGKINSSSRLYSVGFRMNQSHGFCNLFHLLTSYSD